MYFHVKSKWLCSPLSCKALTSNAVRNLVAHKQLMDNTAVLGDGVKKYLDGGVYGMSVNDNKIDSEPSFIKDKYFAPLFANQSTGVHLFISV